MGQVVSLGIGKANLSNTLATYACFKLEPPFHRVTAITSGKRAGGGSRQQVGSHEGNGTLSTIPVEHDNGTVILLQAKWMRGAALLREGGLFLRLRAGAPLYNVIARVPTGHDNLCGDAFLVFSGNADIMNPAELKLAGYEINRGYISRYMDEEELSECYRILKVGGETAPRPAIEAIATPTGIEMREVAQLPLRRLNLRGRKN